MRRESFTLTFSIEKRGCVGCAKCFFHGERDVRLETLSASMSYFYSRDVQHA